MTSVAAIAADRVMSGESRFTRTKTITTRRASGATVAAKTLSEPGVTTTSWLSGFGDDKAVNVAGGALAAWRGEPTTFARIWADASLRQMAGVWMMDAYTTARWPGTLDIACGGPRDGQTWATAATGGMDSTWQATCRKVLAGWGSLAEVHLSMAHELNGNWYPWSVNSTNAADFKIAWRRWYNVVQTELVAKGKNAKVCLNLNSDTSSGVSMLSILPPMEYVDLLGCDFYSMWPDLTTQTLWDRNRLTKKADGAPRGIQSWFDWAKAMGKTLTFPEWAINSQTQSDNPFFIEAMRTIFAANAPTPGMPPGPGQMAGEAYFNAKSQTRLWPTTAVPNSAVRYQQLNFGA